jgi:hypothetical protein
VKDTDQEENANARKDCWREYQPDTTAKGSGKRIQDMYSWSDPFCETIVTILGLAECGDLLSKDGEDGFGGIAGLKTEKERMGG